MLYCCCAREVTRGWTRYSNGSSSCLPEVCTMYQAHGFEMFLLPRHMVLRCYIVLVLGYEYRVPGYDRLSSTISYAAILELV